MLRYIAFVFVSLSPVHEHSDVNTVTFYYRVYYLRKRNLRDYIREHFSVF
jgi:hypothetical protein